MAPRYSSNGPSLQRLHEVSTARERIDHEKIAPAGEVIAPAQMRIGQMRHTHRLEQVERHVDLERVVGTLDRKSGASVQIADQIL